MRKLFAIVFLVLLSGCASAGAGKPLTITRTVYVPFTFPADLTSCPADPAVTTWKHESDVADYIVSLKSTADDCRNVLGAAVSAAALDAAQK